MAYALTFTKKTLKNIKDVQVPLSIKEIPRNVSIITRKYEKLRGF